MTDLRPLPKPAPQGDILRFIYEKDGGEGGGEQKGRRRDGFEKRQDRGREL